MATNQTLSDQVSALRALANRLTLRARDHAAEAKRAPAGDANGEYMRGLAEGYYKSALELAEVLKQYPTGTSAASTPTQPAMPPVNSPAAPPPPAQPETPYQSIPLDEVLRMLMYVDVNPRDVLPQKDGSFIGIFSRWQPLAEHERLDKLKSADTRIIILGTGKTKDSSDPTVHFAFKG
jgi:hypothetical protein